MTDQTVDPMLIDHARECSESGGHVTLFVGGAILTGKPVTTADFLRTAYPDSLDEDELQEMLAPLTKRDQQQRELRQREYDTLTDEEKELAHAQPSTLNLLDARFWGTGSLLPSNGAPMRIKYASIDAWIPGPLTESPRT